MTDGTENPIEQATIQVDVPLPEDGDNQEAIMSANDENDFSDDDVEFDSAEADISEELSAEELSPNDIFGLDPLDVLTLEELADYLKISPAAARRAVKEQNLPGRNLGGEWRFLRDAVANWLRNQEAPAQQQKKAREEFAQTESRFDQQRSNQGEGFRKKFGEGEQSFEEQRGEFGGGRRFGGRQFGGQGQYSGGEGGGGEGGGYSRPPRRPFRAGDQGGGQYGQQYGQGGQYNQGGQYGQGGQGGQYNQGGQGSYGGGQGSYGGGGQRFGQDRKRGKRQAFTSDRGKRMDRRRQEGQSDDQQ